MKAFSATFGAVRLGAVSLGLLVLLLWARQPVRAAWERNQDGLAVLAACTAGGGDGVDPDNDLDPWFAAGLARCQGNDQRQDADGRQDADVQEQTAWLVVMIGSGERLGVIQAARPADAILARLAAERYPHSAAAHLWLAENLTAAGDLPGAIQAYELALQARPTDGLVWRKLGDLYKEEGDWQLAAKAFDQACFWVDSGHNGCVRAGQVYYENKLYDLAIDRYRTTIQQMPAWQGGYRGMANTLMAAGRAQEARPYLEFLAAQGDLQAEKTLQELP